MSVRLVLSSRKVIAILAMLAIFLSYILVFGRVNRRMDTGLVVEGNGVTRTGEEGVSSTESLDTFHPRLPGPLSETKDKIVPDGNINPPTTELRYEARNEPVPGENPSQSEASLSSGGAGAMAPKTQGSKSQCSPARNIVYIKVHKTGSSTLQNIFYRFGDERNLTFVLPASNFYIEGVGQFKPGSVLRAPPGEHYNILANHARFFYDDFKKIMPRDTSFVTLIREAASHFSSMYSYYVMKRQYKVGLERFSLNPKSYFEKYDLNKMGRLSGRDPQLFDLGFNKKDMYSDTKVDDYIQYLDEKMDLVLLSEYFFESLILLKDLMCWDLRTIVHLNSKMRVSIRKANDTNKAEPNTTKANALTKRLNQWNAGDYKLYNHFNRTLWQRVNAYGRDRMRAETEELKELCRRYKNECMSGTKVRDISYWSGPIGLVEYVVRKEKAQNMTCQQLGMSAPDFLLHLRKKHKNRLGLQ